MWLIHDDIKARHSGGGGKGVLVWSTNNTDMENQCSANFMNNRGTMSAKEVLATLS